MTSHPLSVYCQFPRRALSESLHSYRTACTKDPFPHSLCFVSSYLLLLYLILRKEFSKLYIELGDQSLIMCHYKCRLLQFMNNICHSKYLTGTCHTEQGLKILYIIKSVYNCLYCCRQKL